MFSNFFSSFMLSTNFFFSITFSSFLVFIYVPFFFSIIFLKNKINTLSFSTMRNSPENKYVWSGVFCLVSKFVCFFHLSEWKCVSFFNYLLLSCHWVLEWLLSGACHCHGTTTPVIVLAVSKWLLSEVPAALPSLARPLHRLVKEGCRGPGRRPAECSSGWQGHSGSVVFFRHITPPSHYFSSETWLQLVEKLEIRCVRVCVCV